MPTQPEFTSKTQLVAHRFRRALTEVKRRLQRTRIRNGVLSVTGRHRDMLFTAAGRKRFILFLVPSVDIVNGGVLSIFSLAAESTALADVHGAAVATCTAPGEPRNRRFTKFDNAFFVHSLDDLVGRFPAGSEILVHVPEMLIKLFVTDVAAVYRSRPDIVWRFNILLQNIDFIPSRADIATVKALGTTTVTTAHAAYSDAKTAERMGCPVHHMSTYVCPELYPRTGYAEKDKLIVISPDRHDAKARIVSLLREAKPDHRIVEIRDMSYRTYLDTIRRAKFTFTFGEGLDAYFVETVFSGGIGMAVFNGRFFTSHYRGLAGVFDDDEAVFSTLADFLKAADAPDRFAAIGEQQFAVVAKNYVRAEYLANLRLFYSLYFSQPPADMT